MVWLACCTFLARPFLLLGMGSQVPLRDYGKNVWGLPDLAPRDQAKLEQGNKIARALLAIRDDLKKAGHAVALGDHSFMITDSQWHS